MNARSEFIAKWVFDRKGFVIGTERKEDLIRCKDCKYAYKTFNSYTCQRVFHPFTIEDDGFCSWAEREEENESV